MPYSTNRQLPKKVKNTLSSKDQTVWRNVFNSALERGVSETSAARQAWGVIQKSKQDAPNYRVTALSTRNCGQCLFIKGKHCELYDFNVILTNVCDSWRQQTEKTKEDVNVAEENIKKQLTCEVLKVDSSLGIVFGWGMICKIDGEDYYDTDNQRFPETGMMKAVSEFMVSDRTNNDSHTANDVGIVVHSFPLTSEIAKSMGIVSPIHGWMVGVKPDAESLKKFASGELTGFSIEGGAAFVDDEGA